MLVVYRFFTANNNALLAGGHWIETSCGIYRIAQEKSTVNMKPAIYIQQDNTFFSDLAQRKRAWLITTRSEVRILESLLVTNSKINRNYHSDQNLIKIK